MFRDVCGGNPIKETQFPGLEHLNVAKDESPKTNKLIVVEANN